MVLTSARRYLSVARRLIGEGNVQVVQRAIGQQIARQWAITITPLQQGTSVAQRGGLNVSARCTGRAKERQF